MNSNIEQCSGFVFDFCLSAFGHLLKLFGSERASNLFFLMKSQLDFRLIPNCFELLSGPVKGKYITGLAEIEELLLGPGTNSR